MSAEVKGLNRLLERLEKEYGEKTMKRLSDDALKDGAQVFVDELIKEFEKFADTGKSIEEITVSDPMTVNGKRTVKIHWKGPAGRYRIIHLNEFGTVKNPNPDGKGAIARSLKNAENAYHNAIKERIERGL